MMVAAAGSYREHRESSCRRRAPVGQRRPTARCRMGGEDRPDRHLEGPRAGAGDGSPDQHRRRRPGRPACAWRRTSRGVRLPDRLLPLLGARARTRRLHLRPVRRELHRRGARRRRGLHRRSLPHRRCAVRGHPAAGHLLSRRHPHERAARCRRCSLRTTARGSISASSRRDSCRPATRSKRSPTVRNGSRSRTSTGCLPPQQVARAARTRAARAGAKRRLAGQLPRPPRQGRRRRADSPRLERLSAIRVAEIRRESSTITSFLLVPSWTTHRRLSRRPASTSPCGCEQTAISQLVRSYSLSDLPDARGYRISVKREGPGQSLPARTGQGRRPSGRCGSTRDLRIAGRDPPDRADQRRSGGHTNACDAARVGPRAQRATRVVVAWSTQPRRTCLWDRGRRTARGTPRQPPSRRLQPAPPERTAPATTTTSQAD